MAKSRYTAKQRAQALELYLDHGPAETSRRTGIPVGTIRKWAARASVTGPHAKKTEAATEAARAQGERSRAELRVKLLAKAHDLLERMDHSHQEFVGQTGREVHYDKAPANAVKAYATSVGILIDKLRLEEGESTSRDEMIHRDGVDLQVARLMAEAEAHETVPLSAEVLAEREHRREAPLPVASNGSP